MGRYQEEVNNFKHLKIKKLKYQNIKILSNIKKILPRFAMRRANWASMVVFPINFLVLMDCFVIKCRCPSPLINTIKLYLSISSEPSSVERSYSCSSFYKLVCFNFVSCIKVTCWFLNTEKIGEKYFVR